MSRINRGGILKYLTFDDVLLKPGFMAEITSREEVDPSINLGKYEYNIPLVNSPMDTISSPKLCHSLFESGSFGILHRFCSIDEQIKTFTQTKDLGVILPSQIGIAFGIKDWRERVKALYTLGAYYFFLDTAYAYNFRCRDIIWALKEEYGDSIFLTVGTVATPEATQYLFEAGTDCVRINVGAGSVCSTRLKTGVGVPQFSAIKECSKVKRNFYNKYILADGGMNNVGDGVKSIAAGADFIMSGKFFAGCIESSGEDYQGYKRYRGMASQEANEELYGIMPDYKTAEGVAGWVVRSGSVKEIIKDFEGGLRSAMSYIGAKTIKEFQNKAQFIEVSSNTILENGTRI